MTRPKVIVGDVCGTNAFYATPEGWTVDASVIEVGAAFLQLMGSLTDDEIKLRFGKESGGLRYLEGQMLKSKVAEYDPVLGLWK